MSGNENVRSDEQVRSVTLGGHPQAVVNIDKGWQVSGEERGHQPVVTSPEPTSGPSSPSGVSSANTDASSSTADE